MRYLVAMFDRIRKLTKGRCFACRKGFRVDEVPKWVYSQAGSWNKYCKSCFSGVPQNTVRKLNGTTKTRSHAKKLEKKNNKIRKERDAQKAKAQADREKKKADKRGKRKEG